MIDIARALWKLAVAVFALLDATVIPIILFIIFFHWGASRGRERAESERPRCPVCAVCPEKDHPWTPDGEKRTASQ